MRIAKVAETMLKLVSMATLGNSSMFGVKNVAMRAKTKMSEIIKKPSGFPSGF